MPSTPPCWAAAPVRASPSPPSSGCACWGEGLGRGKRLRGGELASAKELRRRSLPWRRRLLLRNRPAEAQPYLIAGIPWPKGAERHHTIVSGTTGSGKTVLISDLVEQIRSRGERCVIYDKMGSYTETFFDQAPGRPAQPPRRPRAALVALPRGPHRAGLRHDGGSADPPPEGRRRSVLDHRRTPALLSRRGRALATGRDTQPGAGGPSAQDRSERTRGGHGGHRDPVHRRSRQPEDGALGARHAHRQHRRHGGAARRGRAPSPSGSGSNAREAAAACFSRRGATSTRACGA